MEKETTGKLISAYVAFANPRFVMGVFSTHLQAQGFLEEECISGYYEMKTVFLFNDSSRILYFEQSTPMEFVTDYPEPKQIIAKKLLKKQALAKLSQEEREALGV